MSRSFQKGWILRSFYGTDAFFLEIFSGRSIRGGGDAIANLVLEIRQKSLLVVYKSLNTSNNGSKTVLWVWQNIPAHRLNRTKYHFLISIFDIQKMNNTIEISEFFTKV